MRTLWLCHTTYNLLGKFSSWDTALHQAKKTNENKGKSKANFTDETKTKPRKIEDTNKQTERERERETVQLLFKSHEHDEYENTHCKETQNILNNDKIRKTQDNYGKIKKHILCVLFCMIFQLMIDEMS